MLIENVNLILDELMRTFSAIDEEQVNVLTRQILEADQVFVTGVGRVLLSMQSVVKRLNHLGVRAYYVGQIDEPAATKRDLLIVVSNSGESLIPVGIARKAASLGVPVTYIGSNPMSTAGRLASSHVRIPVTSKVSEDNLIVSRQPMTSLFEQAVLLLGDAIAMAILEKRGLDRKETWHCHANLE